MVSRRHVIAGSAGALAAWSAPSVTALGHAAAAQASGPGPEIPVVTDGGILIAPPPDLSAGTPPLDSNTNTFVFVESGCTVLANPITVNRSSPGAFNGNSNEATQIPAGTKICSYFVHGDRLDNAGRLQGKVTFMTNTILGLIYETAEFNATAFLETPGTTYAYGAMEGNDFMTLDLTPGSNMVTWDMRFGGVTDQIRIITAC